MTTLFSVRPRGFNIGNDAIFLGMRHLLRSVFNGQVNLVQVPALESHEPGAWSGLLAKSIHEMNLYAQGVIVGGGNLYENGQLSVDPNALRALRPPLMLFSLSHGGIYDHRYRLVPRTDAMPDSVIAALDAHAAISLARDDATLAHLHRIGANKAVLGGCPTLLLRQVDLPAVSHPGQGGTLLSVRHPRLMSIPLASQARLHQAVVDILQALEADGFGPVRILCHDTRDVAFASSLGDIEYILPDDVYTHLALLRSARLVVTFRLHAFLPSLSFGTPTVNISYDERSISLVRTIGLSEWDIDFVRSKDVVAEVRDRCSRLGDLAALREAAQPIWETYETVMRRSMADFVALVTAYAAEGPR